MKSLGTDRPFSFKELLYKSLIFVGVVTLIVYFLPRETKFNYQFDINKPWKYGLLQAAFDFPIYKSDDLIQKEKDSIMADYAPYYNLDKTIGEKMVAKFQVDYRQKLKNFLPANYERYIVETLQEIYRTGIINPNEASEIQRFNSKYLQVVDDNSSKEMIVSEVFTEKEAYNYLLKHDSLHINHILLQKCNLNEYLTSNLTFDKAKSETEIGDLMSGISYATGYVMNGQKIIDRGEIVNQHTYDILRSLEKEWNKQGVQAGGKRLTLLGQVLFVSILILLLFLYLEMFRHDYLDKRRCTYLIFTMITIFPIITSLMIEHAFFSVYILPFTMLPLIVRIFLDGRTAYVVHAISILLCSISLRTPYDFVLLQLTAGMVAIYSLRELSQRSQLLRSASLVTLTYSLIYFSLDMIHANSFDQLSKYMYVNFLISGILVLFTYPLLLILEKVFRFTSNVTLIELSNINNKLMREMSEIAPGTFQHSLQLANLTAAAANRIGANSQLVRTGAMYHDIGKMLNPAFFTENQSGVNPHEHLTYKQSAQVVISHVTDGMKLADKHNLPEEVKNFICTHHGLGLAKYFYISYKNEHPDEDINEEDFRYPGPNPFTKEQAILMMADSVEAASRSLQEYTEDSIHNVVDKLVDAQVEAGYFKNCPITFKEIDIVKTVFKEKLKTMYHTRISYPELKK